MLNKQNLIKIEYAEIRNLLEDLYAMQKEILGEKLVGLYLYGSLVWGDFDIDTSDIDLLAALEEELTEAELEQLREMHAKLVQKYPAWENRIEVQYQSKHGLQTFRTEVSKMGNISPGEPLHFVDGDYQWLLNWYFVQTYGVALAGPEPKTFISPISEAEYAEEIKRSATSWKKQVLKAKDSIKYQSYAILTICRAYYASVHGEQPSKLKAATWVMERHPEWKGLVENALHWRVADETDLDPATTYPEAEKFVLEIIRRIVGD